MKFAIAGSVSTSRLALSALMRHRVNLVGVLGLSREASANVSGYRRLDDLAAQAEVPYMDFTSINSEQILNMLRRWAPDYFFVIGLSQPLKPSILPMPKVGCIGFHPARLPQGRGRAPIAWLTLGAAPGAATLFFID